jgi:16S rRNA (cytosine1402-N4)-methyltransferase
MGWSQMGGWPWFGAAAIDDDLLPWGRCGVSKRDGKEKPAMPPAPISSNLKPEDYHVPIMVAEVLAALKPCGGRLILDGTLGGGGHSEALLEMGASVVGMDQDPHALRHARERLAGFSDRFCALRGNFRDFPKIFAEAGVTGLDGILVDLGVSSRQLDDAERGFSFQQDGPLDLRMNPDAGKPASDLIARCSPQELANLLREYGEEPRAWQLAQAVARARAAKPVKRTSQLAAIIEGHTPQPARKQTLARVFQALRIAVNDELGALADFLEQAPRWLRKGGRLAVISFHSLESRLVKRALQRFAAPMLDRPEWPEPRPNPDYLLNLVTKRPITPSPAEIEQNRRARSAELRVAERV